jgi:hypothetical protein
VVGTKRTPSPSSFRSGCRCPSPLDQAGKDVGVSRRHPDVEGDHGRTAGGLEPRLREREEGAARGLGVGQPVDASGQGLVVGQDEPGVDGVIARVLDGPQQRGEQVVEW